MTDRYFIDSCVLVYARDASEPATQSRAVTWLARLTETDGPVVGQQCLHEYYQVVTRKLRPGLERSVARADVRGLAKGRVFDPFQRWLRSRGPWRTASAWRGGMR